MRRVESQPSAVRFPIHHMLLSRKGLRWKEGYIVPFTIYLDDSGTSPSQHVACATALVIPAGRILQLEREWDNLKRKEGFSDFHTSEFVARNTHSVFAAWEDVKIQRVFKRVREITKKYILQIFSFAVKKDDYDNYVPYELRQHIGKHHYSWALRHVTQFAQMWRLDRSVAEPYEWIFDWMEKRDPARKEVEAVMDQSEEEAQRQRGVFGEYSHFDFRRRATLAGLQCADLIAWTNYNFALEKFRNIAVNPFAQTAWNDFHSMPVGSSASIHKLLEWNFCVTIKPDHLKEWARKELADGRSLVSFREWETKKKTRMPNASKGI